ncbi:MAG: tryptophan 7-halogenase [Ardenticatenales bacterium]|nr:tryptophan 7-halogenase [Ardenticatenales bacterium]
MQKAIAGNYEVIVIGGGPAGSSTATWLAQQGRRVLLLEGKRFPRHHIGESLLAISIPLLKELGVEPKLQAAGFLNKQGALFIWGETKNIQELKMSYPGYAYQVVRSHFDQLLLDQARDQGVTVLQSHWVRQLLYDDGRVCGVKVCTKHGKTHELHCRFVVDASGLAKFIPRQLGLPLEQDGPKRVALSAYYRRALRPAPPYRNHILSEAVQDGWLWFIPLSEDITSVGFVSDAEILTSNPQEVLEEQIATGTLVRKMLEPALLERDVTILNYTNHIVSAPLWGNGYVLVGDTAFFVDPLFSTGVHSALYTASLASAALASVLTSQVSEEEACTWYEWKTRKYYGRINTTINLLYSLHPDDTPFWRRRNQEQITEERARLIVRELGPEGISFFANAVRVGNLSLPESIARRISEFTPQANGLVPIMTNQVVQLAPEIRFATNWMRYQGRLVPSFTLIHTRNRVLQVEYPLHSFRARLLQVLDGQRDLAAGIEAVAQSGYVPTTKDRREAGIFLTALAKTGLLQVKSVVPRQMLSQDGLSNEVRDYEGPVLYTESS